MYMYMYVGMLRSLLDTANLAFHNTINNPVVHVKACDSEITHVQCAHTTVIHVHAPLNGTYTY